jgi:hypothetical protein
MPFVPFGHNALKNSAIAGHSPDNAIFAHVIRAPALDTFLFLRRPGKAFFPLLFMTLVHASECAQSAERGIISANRAVFKICDA